LKCSTSKIILGYLKFSATFLFLFCFFRFLSSQLMPHFFHSLREYLLHFSTRRFSRFFPYMYLSLDPFTQQSIYVYRFTYVSLFFLSPLRCISHFEQNSTFCSCRNTIQPLHCRYSYSAAVNNRLHVLFLMWGYFFFSKTTLLRVRFRQLLDAATPIKRVPTFPPSHSLVISEKRSYLTVGLDKFEYSWEGKRGKNV